MSQDEEDETGGYDPEAMARRRAHVADAPKFKILREPEEPSEFTAWLAEKDKPIDADWQEFITALGPKPRQTAGPMGPRRKAELAQWWANWSEGRLEMDKEKSAVFSNFPAFLLNMPAALFHGKLRADRRQTLVEQSKKGLAQKLDELAKAKAELFEAEAPKRQGRAIAAAALKAGYAKLASALANESRRRAATADNLAAMPQDTPVQRERVAQKRAVEAARAEAAEAIFEAKLAGLEALEANLQPVSADSVQQ